MAPHNFPAPTVPPGPRRPPFATSRRAHPSGLRPVHELCLARELLRQPQPGSLVRCLCAVAPLLGQKCRHPLSSPLPSCGWLWLRAPCSALSPSTLHPRRLARRPILRRPGQPRRQRPREQRVVPRRARPLARGHVLRVAAAQRAAEPPHGQGPGDGPAQRAAARARAVARPVARLDPARSFASCVRALWLPLTCATPRRQAATATSWAPRLGRGWRGHRTARTSE